LIFFHEKKNKSEILAVINRFINVIMVLSFIIKIYMIILRLFVKLVALKILTNSLIFQSKILEIY